MSIVDETIERARELADATAKKAVQISGLTKSNLKLAEIKNSIDKEYKELGMIIYNAVKNNEEYGEKVEEKISMISDLQLQKDELSLKIADLKNKKICPECQKENDKDNEFCGKCGTKL